MSNKMTTARTTFVDACLAGSALLSDIDDWVREWHTEDDVPDTLQEHLGLTDDEFKLWVEKPESLRFSVAAHRYGIPVSEIVTSQKDYALAARAANAEDAQRIVDWLVATGRIDPDAAAPPHS